MLGGAAAWPVSLLKPRRMLLTARTSSSMWKRQRRSLDRERSERRGWAWVRGERTSRSVDASNRLCTHRAGAGSRSRRSPWRTIDRYALVIDLRYIVNTQLHIERGKDELPRHINDMSCRTTRVGAAGPAPLARAMTPSPPRSAQNARCYRHNYVETLRH